jgi:hypothetical protein
MQYFELLVILLGIVNGALLPLLPDPQSKVRPIGAILWFSVTMALFIGFLPVITASPRFVTTTIIAFAGAVAGYFAVKAAKAPVPTKPATVKTQPAKQHA